VGSNREEDQQHAKTRTVDGKTKYEERKHYPTTINDGLDEI
jgi:hypothetical protein